MTDPTQPGAPPRTRCPHGHPVAAMDRFCPVCGAHLAPVDRADAAAPSLAASDDESPARASDEVHPAQPVTASRRRGLRELPSSPVPVLIGIGLLVVVLVGTLGVMTTGPSSVDDDTVAASSPGEDNTVTAPEAQAPSVVDTELQPRRRCIRDAAGAVDLLLGDMLYGTSDGGSQLAYTYGTESEAYTIAIDVASQVARTIIERGREAGVRQGLRLITRDCARLHPVTYR